MRDTPPTPIMSEKMPQRASRFPLGVANREGMFKLSELETHAKGRLRIPDIIILNVTDDELISMRIQGKADWTKLIPVQRNIAKVVEIKFGNDRLSKEQRRDYIRVAGSQNKFRLLEDVDCNCIFRDSNWGGQIIGEKYTYIQNNVVRIILLHQHGKSNIPQRRNPTPISDFLDQAPFHEIALGAGIVVVVVGAIVFIPAGAAAAGVGGISGLILAAS